MSVAPRYAVPPQQHRPRNAAVPSRRTQKREHSASRMRNTSSRSRKVEKLKIGQQQFPWWWRSLLFLQRGSSLATFFLVAMTLTIYSWTVYNQQQWMREFKKLETLQRQERNLTTTNEVMKDQLAQQAEKPGTGLVTPSPANTIFLPPAPPRQVFIAPPQNSEPNLIPEAPMGY
ncbi:MAG: hypothetical protein KME06_06365 [Kastovskya adunca ATA6-11-RM4]|nr:hypothetical protein [Kastovskya adunca ATA6-11-RM4]